MGSHRRGLGLGSLAALAVLVGACGGATDQDGQRSGTGGALGTGATPGTGAVGTGSVPTTGGSAGSGSTGSGSTGSGATGGAGLTEEMLAQCAPGDTCIPVPYSHCCGATKRAINSDYRAAYDAEPAWQVFDDPGVCAMIGACRDDHAVVDAWCRPEATGGGTCQLIFPEDCPALACELDCDSGLWPSTVGCPTCACAPPALTFSVPGWMGTLDDVSLTTALSVYIGGINRTFFDFTFRYDDPESDDEEVVVTAHLALAQTTGPLFGAEATYALPSEIEGVTATLTVPFAGATDDLTVVEGYLSVRQNGSNLEGGVYLVATGPSGSVVVGGAFDEPSPWDL